jgi:hypothetical protein
MAKFRGPYHNRCSVFDSEPAEVANAGSGPRHYKRPSYATRLPPLLSPPSHLDLLVHTFHMEDSAIHPATIIAWGVLMLVSHRNSSHHACCYCKLMVLTS